MPAKRVLDLGSGLNPDYRATDTVDFQKEKAKDLISEERNHFKFQIRPLNMAETKIKELQNYRDNHINQMWGINYNIRLPYPDNKFDLVVSHSSLAAFGEPKAYREVYRVLKKGGIIEVRGAALPKDRIDRITKNLTNAHFTNIQLSKQRPDTRLFIHNIDNEIFKNDIVYAKK